MHLLVHILNILGISVLILGTLFVLLFLVIPITLEYFGKGKPIHRGNWTIGYDDRESIRVGLGVLFTIQKGWSVSGARVSYIRSFGLHFGPNYISWNR